MNQWVSQGYAVTLGTFTVPTGIPLESGHYYSLVSIATDSSGTPTTVTLRNPWGGSGDYVTLSVSTLKGMNTMNFIGGKA